MNESRMHPAVRAVRGILGERGISKSEFARQLGWGRMQVYRRLSGESELTVPELEQIADVLDVPLSRLLPAAEPAA